MCVDLQYVSIVDETTHIHHIIFIKTIDNECMVVIVFYLTTAQTKEHLLLQGLVGRTRGLTPNDLKLLQQRLKYVCNSRWQVTSVDGICMSIMDEGKSE